MDKNHLGTMILEKRKALGITQMELASRLHISFQAVSRWENGLAYPDIELVPQIADILNTSTDALLGHTQQKITAYEDRYQSENYYWGLVPNKLCYEILRMRPPIHPQTVLDIGCGEGKDAVFLARNGYQVMAFDCAESGLEKATKLAKQNNVCVDFLKADIHEFRLKNQVDIVYSSGVFHYIRNNLRKELVDIYKQYVKTGGLAVINVFVDKPFIERAPDDDTPAGVEGWKSGEILTLFHDWKVLRFDEVIFDCLSDGIPHKHCMDILIAEKV